MSDTLPPPPAAAKSRPSGASRSSLGRAFSTSAYVTRQFLQRTFWLWPIAAMVALALIGGLVYSSVENAMRDKMAAEIKTILSADLAALEIWLRDQEGDAANLVQTARIQTLTGELLTLELPQDGADTLLRQHPTQKALRDELRSWLKANNFDGYVLLKPDGFCVASLRDDNIGVTYPSDADSALAKVLRGRPIVTRPMKANGMIEDAQGRQRIGLPTMFAGAAVHDNQNKAIGALGLRIRPDIDFTRILSVASGGETCETYAFDKNGLMLSMSRFDPQLKSIGLLPDDDQTQSILNLQVRDPGVNMAAGARPETARANQPLTRMALAAIADADNPTTEIQVDVAGYRDYRGVPVVGAWKWLPEYGFGVATEMDMTEAYAPLYVLRVAIWTLFGLVGLAMIGIFVSLFFVARLQQRVQKAALENKRLGQYTLEEKLGAGGMGVVYRGRHAMMRRPTAIKLLGNENSNPDSVARFEREVQLTSQLNHPNTIAIYDFGRTPEGIFYYAMEYLDGINLETLVERYGPLPEGRVIQILSQVCGSLIEAHGAGLIHRDIKPANVMLNHWGGVADFVKLLDFGLARAADPAAGRLTSAEVATGTPLYMSPEAIHAPTQVDARSDLYAVGALGYFLLTGTPVFNGTTVVEICMHHIRTTPELPSQRLRKAVSPELEQILLKCLEKGVNDRPQSARELRHALLRLPQAGSWTSEDADAWWEARSSSKDKGTVLLPGGSINLGSETPGSKPEGVGTLVVRNIDR